MKMGNDAGFGWEWHVLWRGDSTAEMQKENNAGMGWKWQVFWQWNITVVIQEQERVLCVVDISRDSANIMSRVNRIALFLGYFNKIKK